MCGKSCLNYDYLQNHINTVHKGEKNYKCVKCGEYFDSFGFLEKHVETVQCHIKKHKTGNLLIKSEVKL